MSSEKRKLPRFHVSPCQFHDGKLQKNFSVQDVSLGGLAIHLVDRSDLPLFAVGSEHAGVIKIEGLKTECRFQVRYLRGTLVGAEWQSPSQVLAKHLEEISHAENLGPGIKHYDLPDVTSTTWYHHPVGIDLLFYPPNGDSASSSKVGRWMIYVHQTFVQWEMDTGIRTGKTMAEDEEGYAHGIVRLETRMVDQDVHINGALIRWVETLVENTSALPDDLKNLVLSQLKGIA
jgi:hypothetical protein